jgi:hypothetical protein
MTRPQGEFDYTVYAQTASVPGRQYAPERFHQQYRVVNSSCPSRFDAGYLEERFQ